MTSREPTLAEWRQMLLGKVVDDLGDWNGKSMGSCKVIAVDKKDGEVVVDIQSVDFPEHVGWRYLEQIEVKR